MAGAGYKLFNTGDVLTAAQVNTYLMEQSVMVFANAAARTTALSGVLAEGMLSYLKDTDAVEVYNGSAWVASDDPNAIQNSIVDAKGDLISASAADVPARLAVGNNGESLVADSSTTTGLRWQGNFAAAKNKIINGDFGIWARGTTFNNAAGDTSTADRFAVGKDGTATINVTRESFTAGSAPVAGYESQYFLKFNITSWTSLDVYLSQKIEDVRTFANQTVTVSFWAKADTSFTNTVLYQQNFGSGGSAAVVGQSTHTIGTSWSRHSLTFNIPSISGKTIGSSSFIQFQVLRFQAARNVDIWGVQVEAGNTATAFQTATGSLAGELALCQRYYYRHVDGASQAIGVGYNESASSMGTHVKFPVTMRITPVLVASSGSAYYQFYRNGATDDFNSFTLGAASPNEAAIYNNSEISGTAGHAGNCYSNNASASVAFNAEL